MSSAAREYIVYADGACIGNPGPGGWGVVIAEPASERRALSGGPVPNTTNNRMEITAAIEALRALEEGAHVTLRTDSEYVVKTMTLGWKRNANRELWDELDRLVAKRKVRFEWVAGHAGNHWNEQADKLARARAEGRIPPDIAAPAERRHESVLSGEAEVARRMKSRLRDGETIRKCAACGQLFVSRNLQETCCSRIACQLKARR
jgi:ribonuclease HI